MLLISENIPDLIDRSQVAILEVNMDQMEVMEEANKANLYSCTNMWVMTIKLDAY